ncbi:Non-specific lipid-transfer protein [Bienertia sinuspersici]
MGLMANYNHIVCVVFLMALVVGAPLTNGAVTCGTVASSLAPCVSYFQGGAAGAVPGGCCTGIRNLNSAAQSTPDRQMVCQCLKSAARSMPNVNVGLASSIPPKCGVNIPYKLDPATDCSTIH